MSEIFLFLGDIEFVLSYNWSKINNIGLNDMNIRYQSFKPILSQLIVFTAFLRFCGQNYFWIVSCWFFFLTTESFKHLQAKYHSSRFVLDRIYNICYLINWQKFCSRMNDDSLVVLYRTFQFWIENSRCVWIVFRHQMLLFWNQYDLYH
jgi:hypothetical protein